ncbi:MAG: serine/threonine protein kinase [Planctomycetes bacterium]|nr:serine/threonine protein kinase [Planctomycetota bacterium]
MESKDHRERRKCFEHELTSLYDSDMDEEDVSDDSLVAHLHQISDKSRYREKQLIGRGGMKDVYRVLDDKVGRYIAMATLKDDAPEELYDPFLREARLTALLDHPNIISLYDIGLDAHGGPYFTMELKNGQSLSEFIDSFVQKGEEAPLNNLMEVFLKITDAIAHAHSHNVLHLDLKPDNIQIGQYGEVLVCDWGLGKVLGVPDYCGEETDALLLNPDLLNSMTLSGSTKGTPGFMAPEQIHKDVEEGFASDIYSLGAILYNMLAATPPVGGDVDEMLRKTVNGEIIPPEKLGLRNTCSVGLSAVVMRSLSLDPTERYQSVKDLKKDIQTYLSGYATLAENAGIVKEISLFVGRHKQACILSILFVVMLISVVSFSVLRLHASREVTKKALFQVEASHRQMELLHQKAQRNLLMYEEEKQKIERLTIQRSYEISEYSAGYLSNRFFDNPENFASDTMEVLEKALAIDSSNQRAIELKGQLHLVMQRFPQALACFVQMKKDNRDLMILSRRMDEAPKAPSGLLEIEYLVDMIKFFGHQETIVRRHLCERIVAFDAVKRKDKTGYGDVINALVRVWNKFPGYYSFKYDAAEKSLVLNGSGLRTLQGDAVVGSGKCLLRFLPFTSLWISNSQLYNLHEITDLVNLEDITLLNNSLTIITPLNKLPSLKRVIIGEGQFSSNQVSRLHKHLEVKQLRQ